MNDECQQDTSKEIYREPAKDWKGNGYEPSVGVNPSGAITMCAGGRCVTKPIKEWVNDSWMELEKREMANLSPLT